MSASTGLNDPYFCTLPDISIFLSSTATVSSNLEGAGTLTAEKEKEDEEAGTTTWKLGAKANKGYVFLGWADAADPDQIISTNQNEKFDLLEDTQYIAVFRKSGDAPQALVMANPLEGGSVKAELTSSDGEKEAAWKLTAEANKGYRFLGWTLLGKENKYLSTDKSYTVTVKKDTAYAAIFEKEEAEATPTDTPTPTPSPSTAPDKEVTLSYENYPVTATGELEGYELKLTALKADDADVKLMQKSITSDNALIRLYDVKLYKDGTEVQPEKPLKLNFNVGTKYNGQTLTVLHVVDGKVEKLTGTAQDGILTVTAASLSSFGVVVDASSVGDTTIQDSETPGSGTPGTTSTGGSGTGSSGYGSGSSGGSSGSSGGQAASISNQAVPLDDGSSISSGAKTGDETPTVLYLAMFGAAGAASLLILRRKKRS